jgi:hypothetical protein
MSAPRTTYRVEIVTKDHGIVSTEGTALPAPIQAARVLVTSDQGTRSHVVVRAAAPPWQLPTDEAPIRALFPEDFVACIRSDVPGATTLSCPEADDATRVTVAAAAATLKRSWGWDESPAILVRFASGQAITVNPIFTGGVWTVSDV